MRIPMRGGLTVGEPDDSLEDPRLSEYSEPRIGGQTSQDLELCHQSGVKLCVKPAERRLHCLMRDFLLPIPDFASKFLE